MSENGRDDLLISLYSQTYGEITRYRDMEWKIWYWTVALMAGIVSLARLSGVELSAVRWFLSGVVIILGVYGIWHIRFVHIQLTWNRKMRRRLERMFKFYDEGVYADEAILPKSWKEKDVSFRRG